jgi:putative membrane-bound dehydrogenase-like protein
MITIRAATNVTIKFREMAGRATPSAPLGSPIAGCGAHGVTRSAGSVSKFVCRCAGFGYAVILSSSLLATVGRGAERDLLSVGVAAVDITPDYPIRLNGFGSRRTESEGITQKIWAKALAFQDEKQGPAILIAADNLGVPDEIVQEVAARLSKKVGLARERLTVTATHTHTAPMLKGVSPTVFGVPIPPEHQEHIDRYTEQFTDKLEQVALDALKDVRPARLSWGIGTVGFAMNRRNKDGPVDHDLPLLFVTDLNGKVRAVYFSYACHCVTLSHNQISGDWAGYAQEAVRKMFPDAIALASVGCGADSNPSSGVTGDRVTVCANQGEQIAQEVKRLFSADLTSITAGPMISYSRVDVPFDKPRARAEWEERAKSSNYAVAYHARLNLSRLDRGEKLPTQMVYPVQSWLFGDQLAIVFLPGETVVDYSLRLKREFDRKRLWVNGYANESRCYLPSERILEEGGYEGGDAMIYYDRPQRFAPGVEQRIIGVVTAQVPESFVAATGTEGIRPLSPTESLRTIRIMDGLQVELVAAEPLVTSPVAVDWAPDGRLWVCEMFDYPAGVEGDFQPGGRVRFLEDVDRDGRYDKSTTFLESLRFPTGVTAWGRGVLICAAPDILYAEDTDGDGKADKIEKLFSGFATENYQARVNSLTLGLDNWVYGANGLTSRTVTNGSKVVEIRNHDFRFQPLKGAFEPVSGLSQQGRVRDDWGQWFGCDNGSMLIFFPNEERYSRRNPHVPAPMPSVRPPGDLDAARIYPASKLLERFNDPEAANRVTSACGIAVYRDNLLGKQYYGNTFTCEPVHNLVHRLVLDENSGQLKRRRGQGERESEFLASTDNWFRPVQVRTGPDGALYVVDMYRFVIEHPRWIPAARLAKLDARAGADKGRIYRVRPIGKAVQPIRDLIRLNADKLAAALDSPNGTDRDRVHIELLVRRDKATFPALEHLASDATLAQVRLQSLCVLDGLGALRPALLDKALTDGDARVRQQAIRLCEPFLQKADEANAHPFAGPLLSLTNDASPGVWRQLALTLGEWNDSRASRALACLARKHPSNADLRTAILSSATAHCGELLPAVVNTEKEFPDHSDWIPPLVATAAGSGRDSFFIQALSAVLSLSNSIPLTARLNSLASLLEALDRKQTTLAEYLSSHPELRNLEPRLGDVFASARRLVTNSAAPENSREAATKLLGHGPLSSEDLILFCNLVTGSTPNTIRAAALAALRRQRSNEIATHLLGQWRQTAPAVRTELVTMLISREGWARALLAAVRQGTVSATEISITDRQYLLRKASDEIQQLAAQVFPAQTITSRSEVLHKYEAVNSLSGDARNGADIFSRNCATCHLIDGVGHDVGPDLATLRNKDTDYWVKNILDPNAVIEPRFVSYEIELKDDRAISGVTKSETGSSIIVAGGSGVTETIERGDIVAIRASTLSLMPEGLEQGITVQEMADLITFLRGSGSAAASVSANVLLRDPASIARLILDDKQPKDVREAVIGANPQFASDLILEMTRDLKPGTPEEYVRIPWIWRVAVACGKRNDGDEVKRVLAISLPSVNDNLADWQAVVIGGGIINGLSLRGHWPAERLGEILAGNEALHVRWTHMLELAAAMAENEKTPTGTRYDALRILALEPWDRRRAQLTKYLAKGVNEELQQGAISALSDIRSPHVAPTLASGLHYYSKRNRELALDALMREESRINALLEQLAAGQITKADLGEKRLERLKQIKSEALAARIRSLLSE